MQSQGLPSSPTMPQQDPLEQLRDIHVSADVNTWPLDWGWWCLTAILLFVSIWAVRTIRKHIRFNKPRKQALELLGNLSAQHNNWPIAINELIKRTALTYFPHHEVAGLYGEAWRAFVLAQLSKGNPTVESGLLLIEKNSYQEHPNTNDFTACQQAAKIWLSKVRVAKTLSSQHRQHKRQSAEVSHA